jgi:uncharacterized protein with ParB-like and HNH nuclease domain
VAEVMPKPKASAESVADLVALVMSGHVRIPVFQRGFKWGAADVVALFESIYLGYPVGSLLFHRGPAQARMIEVGPIKVRAPETSGALWVVDGQQRLAASIGKRFTTRCSVRVRDRSTRRLWTNSPTNS